ncbi:hypothetical protein N7451_012051 [Penicillium sp. IBT 35674x]|nr:hypothetical protein N7451_012051 [Penicillium sp. IBT 35674x]
MSDTTYKDQFLAPLVEHGAMARSLSCRPPEPVIEFCMHFWPVVGRLSGTFYWTARSARRDAKRKALDGNDELDQFFLMDEIEILVPRERGVLSDTIDMKPRHCCTP